MSKCKLCNSENTKRSIFGGYCFNNAKFYLQRCIECGFLYLDPVPGEQILAQMYSDPDYFKTYWVRNSGVLGYVAGRETARENAKATLDVLKRYKYPGALIDIGCAGGHFLGRAKNLGYECYGVEINSEMSEYARNTYGFKVIDKELKEFSDSGMKFDIVYMGDTLEHLPDLNSAFKSLEKLMRDDSMLVIDGPLTYNRSLFTLVSGLNMFLKKNRLSGNKPYHIWEFNGKTIRKLLELYNYEIVSLGIFEDPPRYIRGFDGDGIKDRSARLVKNISRSISNNFLFKWLEMGDRVLVLAKKKTPALKECLNKLKRKNSESP